MIFKSFEFKKINTKEYCFYLFYGENNGLKKELIDTNFKTMFMKRLIIMMKLTFLKIKIDFLTKF